MFTLSASYSASIDTPALVARWIHIVSATIAIGGPIFMRFALLPAAAATLDPATHAALREQLMKRWKRLVYTAITAFILSGLYTFLVVRRWADPSWSPANRALYHMLFGIKVILALAMFFLASALTGRAAAFAPIRKNAKFYTVVLIVLGLVIIAMANVMRTLPLTITTAP